MAKIAVTGGAGFIGSHVVDALVAEGHDVDVIDDLSGGRAENVHPEATLHQLDIRSVDAAHLFKNRGIEILIHHAAQMDVRRSVADPAFDADVNVRGVLNLLEAGRKAHLKRVIFASTGGAIYGEPEYTPQDENHPLKPLSPYGITKLCTEKYLAYYRHEYGLDYAALRYGNVYGPRQNPHGEAGVVAIFTERMLGGLPLRINGDGLQTRDYVFVEDVVRANMAALSTGRNGIFNVGTGIETSVVALFHKLRAITGSDAEEIHGDAAPGEQRRSVLSWEHSQGALGWNPSVGIDEGLTRTVDWFRSRTAKLSS